MNLYFAMLIGLVIGSIPSAFLIVKRLHGVDILSEGSKNMGAMNSYESTGSRKIGVFVLIADVAKGAIAVLLISLLPDVSYSDMAVGGLWAVIGHNFSIFMGLKGGRGLATTVGVFLVLNPIPVILWLLLWLTAYYVIKRHIHIANAIATVATPIMVFSTPDKLLDIAAFMPITDHMQFKILVTAVCIVILIRHIKPLMEYVKESENS
jgi:glycerol-3-phosphate acyltransferase PlsY